MTYKILMILSLFLALTPLSALARGDRISVDLAQDHVDITTGFNGAALTLFGMREGQGDIAIVIRGAAHNMIVRKKSKIVGAWVNGESMKFNDVPVYYDYALSDLSLAQNLPEVLMEKGVGLDALGQQLYDAQPREKDRDIFKKSLIRNKQNEGLFPLKPKGITFLNDQFFRADFYIPANVPVGDYQILTYYFSGNKIKDTNINILRVAQVGTSSWVYNFSKNHAFIYGALSVFLALFAGWFSNRVRRS